MRILTALCLTATANLAHATPARTSDQRISDGVGAALSVGVFGAILGAYEHERGGLIDFDFAQGFAAGSLIGALFMPTLYDLVTDGDGALGASLLGSMGSMMLVSALLGPSGPASDGKLYLAGSAAAAGAGLGYAMGDPLSVTPAVLPDGDQQALGLGFSGSF